MSTFVFRLLLVLYAAAPLLHGDSLDTLKIGAKPIRCLALAFTGHRVGKRLH